MRGVENNRKGTGSSRSLGQWMLSWLLPLFSVCTWAGFCARRWAKQRALTVKELFKSHNRVFLYVFVQILCYWHVLDCYQGSLCLPYQVFLSRGRVQVKAVSWWEQTQPHLWWACAEHQVLLQHGCPCVCSPCSRAGICFFSPPSALHPKFSEKKALAYLCGSQISFCEVQKIGLVSQWCCEGRSNLSLCTLILGMNSGCRGENTVLRQYIYTSTLSYLGKIFYCFMNACNAIKAYYFLYELQWCLY